MAGKILFGSKPDIHPAYRADIDGLRAIAVLSVVGFHAFPGWVKGGFIGVDIFFVISGFLISSIILANLDAGSFSFIDFYSRRIRRIFPALLLVLSACFAFAWYALFAGEFEQLGKHIAAGASFLSNYAFWAESGYFDKSAESKTLLHLWSLGIEEQFYIIWPLLLWISWKARFNPILIIAVLGASSFLFNLFEVNNDVVAAFYSPQTRFWELLVGAALAYATLYKVKFFVSDLRMTKNFLSLAGMSLIIAGFLLIQKETPFPGWWAILPTAGVALIIASGPETWLSRRISTRIMVWFGKISYPLYLWHWPFLSFIFIVYAEYHPSVQLRLAAVALAVACAWLTYRLVEKPFRFGSYPNAKAAGLAVSMLFVGSAGLYGYQTGGFDGYGFRSRDRQAFADYFENSPPDLRYFLRTNGPENFHDACNFYNSKQGRLGNPTQIPVSEIPEFCFRRDNSYKKLLFIWGDSYAQHLYYGLRRILPADWQILQVASSGCKPSINSSEPSTTNYCAQSNWFALKVIADTKPDVVITGQTYEHDINSMKMTAERLKALGVGRVLITGPTPHWTATLPNIIMRRLWTNTPRRTFTGSDQQILPNNKSILSKFTNTDSEMFVNTMDLFCNQDGCLTYLGDDKMTGLTTFDHGHLTPIASDYLAKNLLVPLIVGNNTKLP